jgi:hypothetical protein
MTIDILKPELKEYGTPTQNKYLDAVLEHGSATRAAVALGVDRRTVDRCLSALKRTAIDAGTLVALDDHPKVLLLDIETAPILSHIWAMWNEVRNIDQIITDWYVLSWGAKWLGSPKESVEVKSLRDYKGYRPGSEDDKALLLDMHKLLCEAEYVIAHNGDRFDIKKLNTRFVLNGIDPPTPYRSIDTLKISKRIFGFTSNKLDFLARVLLGDRKVKHDGLELWQQVLTGSTAAWDKMEEYNGYDVDLLERVYLKLRAWDHLHPNMNLTTTNDNMACTVCTSNNVKPTGGTVAVGQAGLYLGYVCRDCGHQMRGKTNIRTLGQKHAGLVNAK